LEGKFVDCAVGPAGGQQPNRRSCRKRYSQSICEREIQFFCEILASAIPFVNHAAGCGNSHFEQNLVEKRRVGHQSSDESAGLLYGEASADGASEVGADVHLTKSD